MRLEGRTQAERSGHDAETLDPDVAGPLHDGRIAAVLRLLRGEPLLTVAEETQVLPAVLLEWRDAFLEGGRERLDRPAEPAGPVPDPPPAGPADDAGPRSPLRPRLMALLAIGAVAVLIAAVAVVGMVGGESDIAKGWLVVHDGFGKAGVERSVEGEQVHFLKPMISQAAGETHGALKTTEQAYEDLELDLRMRTVQQLRSGTPPNPWETAWVVWHYTDDRHFYYLTLKPNGWELGKRDPNHPGGQRFLVSDIAPTYYFATWYDVRIEQEGPVIKVWVGGVLLTRFIDEERPYLQGRVGLYVEDAYAQFADVEPSGTTLRSAGGDN